MNRNPNPKSNEVSPFNLLPLSLNELFITDFSRFPAMKSLIFEFILSESQWPLLYLKYLR